MKRAVEEELAEDGTEKGVSRGMITERVIEQPRKGSMEHMNSTKCWQERA